jgi:hypothetical protein
MCIGPYTLCIEYFVHYMKITADLHTIHTPVEAAEGRMAHNGWNGVDGMVSNTWKPCV